jgi:hypothetical protein
MSLQLRYLLAYYGFGNTQRIGCGGKTAILNNGRKCLKIRKNTHII